MYDQNDSRKLYRSDVEGVRIASVSCSERRLGAIIYKCIRSENYVMSSGQNETFSRILIDKALEFRGRDLLNPQQAPFEFPAAKGRLIGSRITHV